VRHQERDAEAAEKKRDGQDGVGEAERDEARERELLHDVQVEERENAERRRQTEERREEHQLVVQARGGKARGHEVDHETAQPEPEHGQRDRHEGVVAEERHRQDAGHRDLEHQ